MIGRLIKLVLVAYLFFPPCLALAGAPAGPEDFGLTPTAEKAGLATTGVEPEIIVGNIIKALLGFLGLVAFVLVIYAGGLWMTAAGSEEKIKKAKDILKGAVIGLIILLASYVITSFVVERIATETLPPGQVPLPAPSGPAVPVKKALF